MTDHPAHTDPTAPESPAQGRKMFWIKLLSAMALILLGVFVLYRVVAYQALQQRIQAVRDAGYPIEPAELNNWYETPEVNAADIYLRAFAAFPARHELSSYDDLPVVGTPSTPYVLGEPLKPEVVSRIENYLAHHTEAIALIEEAALISESRYPWDFRKDFYPPISHRPELRRCARVLQLQSVLDHHRGHHDLAAQRCVSLIAAARSLENEPSLISAFVSLSILHYAHEQIEVLTNEGQLSDDQLKKIIKALEPINVDRMILRAFVGERCFVQAIYGDSEHLAPKFSSNPTLGQIAVVAWRASGLMNIEHICTLDVIQTYAEYAEDPAWPPPIGLQDLDRHVPSICIVTRAVAPMLDLSYPKNFEAQRLTILVGIAVERYRQAHGRFPDQLTDLAPEFLDAVPLDPFDDQPLRYRAEDTGVIIYSLGADGIDHKGRRYDDTGSDFQDNTDIPVTFGGLQELLWPLPEEEEDDFGAYGEYGDPYGGGYDDPYGGSEPIEDESEEEAEAEVESETVLEVDKTNDAEHIITPAE